MIPDLLAVNCISESPSDLSEITQLKSGEVGTWINHFQLLCTTLGGPCHVRNIPIPVKEVDPCPQNISLVLLALSLI